MNPEIEEFVRTRLKELLAEVEDDNRVIFKRMYSHLDLDKDINDVVDDMPVEKLDWAFTQVKNTLDKKHDK